MKIIAIGYNTAGTGLTRVMHSVMRRLADRHEIRNRVVGDGMRLVAISLVLGLAGAFVLARAQSARRAIRIDPLNALRRD